MGIYRKKPVEIEARQWLGTNADEMHEFIGPAMSWHPIDKSLRILPLVCEGKFDIATMQLHTA